jgi:hypothetical protein
VRLTAPRAFLLCGINIPVAAGAFAVHQLSVVADKTLVASKAPYDTIWRVAETGFDAGGLWTERGRCGLGESHHRDETLGLEEKEAEITEERQDSDVRSVATACREVEAVRGRPESGH